MSGDLLVVRDLVKHFPVRKGIFGREVAQVDQQLQQLRCGF